MHVIAPPPPIRRPARVVARVVAALVVAGAAAAVAPSSALGAGAPPPPTPASGGGFNFGVHPYAAPGAPARSAFTFDVAAGQSLDDRVQIVNPGDVVRSFYVYPADAYTTEVGGGFALRLRGEPLHDAGAWITLPVTQYTVPPRSAAIIPVHVAVPAGASPGDHTAGIVAEDIVAANQPAPGAGIERVARVAARVYVRVQGPVRPRLTIRGLTVRDHEPLLPYVTGRGGASVSFSVVNTGNVRAQLNSLEVRLSGLLGRRLHRATYLRPSPGDARPNPLPDQLLPGATVRFSVSFDGLPVADAVTARVALAGEDPVLHRSIPTVGSKGFWVVPWVLLLILLAAGAVWLWWRRRAGPAAWSPEPARGGGGESVRWRTPEEVSARP